MLFVSENISLFTKCEAKISAWLAQHQNRLHGSVPSEENHGYQHLRSSLIRKRCERTQTQTHKQNRFRGAKEDG